mmetsp:Transcript_13227/g.19945  ORF Transcript_13227/g.19945 Transcript_13227/m.19945 type:complete len:211 (-) Transcript_13227:43-675(-)
MNIAINIVFLLFLVMHKVCLDACLPMPLKILKFLTKMVYHHKSFLLLQLVMKNRHSLQHWPKEVTMDVMASLRVILLFSLKLEESWVMRSMANNSRSSLCLDLIVWLSILTVPNSPSLKMVLVGPIKSKYLSSAVMPRSKKHSLYLPSLPFLIIPKWMSMHNILVCVQYVHSKRKIMVNCLVHGTMVMPNKLLSWQKKLVPAVIPHLMRN